MRWPIAVSGSTLLHSSRGGNGVRFKSTRRRAPPHSHGPGNMEARIAKSARYKIGRIGPPRERCYSAFALVVVSKT